MDYYIHIKEITIEEEIIAVEALAKEIWHQHYIPIIGQEQVDYMLNKLYSTDAIKADIANGYVYSLAFCDDILCGYSVVKIENGVFLSKFYVSQLHRGKGVGRMMFNKIMAFAKERNIERIWLTCNRNNTDSLSIYRKLGFTVIDSVDTDIGRGFYMNDYILEKDFKDQKV